VVKNKTLSMEKRINKYIFVPLKKTGIKK